MAKTETAISFMEKIARDNSHGYDQNDRWGHPNFDCSGLVITAWNTAGVKTGATYTGDMYKAFLRAGFKNVTQSVSLYTGAGMKRGDVLLSPGHHTAMYCGNGLMVDARINEKGRITGGKSGDQTGHEIEIHNYNNHPWKYVLRYPENTGEEPQKTDPDTNASVATNGGNLMFRKHPTTTADTLDSIPSIANGERIKVIRNCAAPGWLFVRYKGRYGYVYGQWVKRD